MNLKEPRFHRRFWPLAATLLLVLGACMSTPASDAGGFYQSRSAYGNFLAARYASASHDVLAAASFYAAAQKQAPGNDLLVKQAFLSALLAGDVLAASAFAEPALGTAAETRLMRLTRAAYALGKRRYRKAETVLAEGEYGPFNEEARQLLRGWSTFGAGDVQKALALIAGAGNSPVFANTARLHRALVLDLAGRDAAAGKAYELAVGGQVSSDRAAYAYGAYLWRHGQAKKARALCEEASRRFIDAPLCRRALSRAGSRAKTMPRLVRNAREGAAEALYGPAQILAAGGHFDRALVYLEMARFIDPRSDAVRELLARLMEVEDRADDALAMFATIAADSAYRLEADRNRASTLIRLDRREEGLALYQQLVQVHPDDTDLLASYADALRSMRKYHEALPLYRKLISTLGGKASWRLYFSKGVVLERTGKWRQSVDDFRQALKIRPDQPDVLNYLGYTYIDAGENLDEGLGMIERALSLSPDSGYIVDSLGWAHYRLGHYQRAVRYLERAVELEPGQTTISDHLGDAYWQAGRHLEARFQWRHTLSLKPDDDVDLAAVRQKLEHGLRDAPELANAKP